MLTTDEVLGAMVVVDPVLRFLRTITKISPRDSKNARTSTCVAITEEAEDNLSAERGDVRILKLLYKGLVFKTF